jgi:hypothetical protein
LVRKAIHKKSEENVKQVFKHYSKLKNKDLENEELSIKSYVKNMKLRDARTYFRIRGNMIMTKINMKNDKKFSDELWRGDIYYYPKSCTEQSLLSMEVESTV